MRQETGAFGEMSRARSARARNGYVAREVVLRPERDDLISDDVRLGGPEYARELRSHRKHELVSEAPTKQFIVINADDISDKSELEKLLDDWDKAIAQRKRFEKRLKS